MVGLIGRLIFNRQFGVVNALLGIDRLRAGRVAGPAVHGAFLAVAIMDVWQWTPFCALILLAGLSMVPVEIEEAARLETGTQVGRCYAMCSCLTCCLASPPC